MPNLLTVDNITDPEVQAFIPPEGLTPWQVADLEVPAHPIYRALVASGIWDARALSLHTLQVVRDSLWLLESPPEEDLEACNAVERVVFGVALEGDTAPAFMERVNAQLQRAGKDALGWDALTQELLSRLDGGPDDVAAVAAALEAPPEPEVKRRVQI